ncbi:MAG: hypothetical protein JNK72_08140 [Myxococcales bacterium]|nr:hypothetical protein [Myxococcales bacterium]
MSDPRHWQTALYRFLTEPEYAARFRRDPAAAAREEGVSEARARWLAALDPRRVEAFARSAAHKENLRQTQ